MNTIYIFNPFINARERSQCQEGGMSNSGTTNDGTQSNLGGHVNGTYLKNKRKEMQREIEQLKNDYIQGYVDIDKEKDLDYYIGNIKKKWGFSPMSAMICLYNKNGIVIATDSRRTDRNSNNSNYYTYVDNQQKIYSNDEIGFGIIGPVFKNEINYNEFYSQNILNGLDFFSLPSQYIGQKQLKNMIENNEIDGCTSLVIIKYGELFSVDIKNKSFSVEKIDFGTGFYYAGDLDDNLRSFFSKTQLGYDNFSYEELVDEARKIMEAIITLKNISGNSSIGGNVQLLGYNKQTQILKNYNN